MLVGLSEDQWERLNMLIENPFREGVYKVELELNESAETEFYFWKIIAWKEEAKQDNE
jgi:hypothetical protein